MSSRVSRLGKNTLLVFLGNMGSKVIGLVMLPFYTRWLSVEDYGLTDIITIYVSFLIGIVTCSIAQSLFIFPKGADIKTQKTYFSSGLDFVFISLMILGAIFLCIKIFAGIYSLHNSFVDNIWFIYAMLISQIVQELCQQFTRSIDKMKVYSITGIICTGCTALYAFIFIPSLGVEGYVLSIILAHFTAALYSFVFSKSYSFFSIKSFNYNKLKEMLAYSIPLIPNGIMWWLVNALNRPIMEKYLGYHDMGIYAVAHKFPGILGMIFTVFATSWQISVLEEYGKKDYANFYNKVFRLVMVFLICILLVITFSSKLLVTIFASTDFFDAWKYIPLLTLGILFSNISAFAGSNFCATRESKYYFYSSAWGAITAVICNFVFIPIWGLYGTCISVIFSFFAMAISRIIYGWKYVKIEKISFIFVSLLLCVFNIILYSLELNAVLLVVASFISIVLIILLNRDLIALVSNKFKIRINDKNT